MTETLTRQREGIAKHESTHAVMANHLLGDALQSVELMSDKGCCRLKPVKGMRVSNWKIVELAEREHCERVIMMLLANGANGDGHDHDQAFEIAMELDGDRDAAQLHIEYLSRQAELIVQKLGPQITRLSEALVRHGKLSGGEVEAILSK